VLNRITPDELRAVVVSTPVGDVRVDTITLHGVTPMSLHVPGTDCNTKGELEVFFA